MRILMAVMVSVCLFMTPVSFARAQGLPYPAYTPYQIKGIGVEVRDQWNFWGMVGNKAGMVVTNIDWHAWQPTKHTNCGVDEILYGGYCFRPPANVVQMVKDYSDQGVLVTGILVGTWPGDWMSTPCTGSAFCTSADPADFGRLAGFVANYFNGLNGHGRIVNFVIHNEVNAPTAWYDNGCGEPGHPACTIAGQVATYAADYNAAYDAIKSEQAAAKVLASMTNYFRGTDDPSGYITIKTYLTQFASAVGGRAWAIAVHPYNENPLSPVFSLDDTAATLGSLGQLVGWLRQSFPFTPSAWEIFLTEQGLHGDDNAPGDAAQADYLCKAYGNVLGTPGVEAFMYTPMSTHVGYWGGSHLELITCTLNPYDCVPGTERYRQSWATWALSNRVDVNQTSCGFEMLPFVKLSRYYNSQRGHRATTRMPPSGSSLEVSWRLLRNPEAGTHLLFECLVASGAGYPAPYPVGGSSYVDRNQSCSGLMPMGPLGYAYDASAAGRVPLYRCHRTQPGYEEYFVSTASSCEGWVNEDLLGYVIPAEYSMVFEHLQYVGANLVLSGDVPFVGWDWNDRITSVKVPPGHYVILYDAINYGGASLTLYSDAPDLRAYAGPGPGGTWNDTVSSIRVF
jgi:Family of unknown function (DUF5722)/Peptidase inhibitor family I36